MITDRDLAKQPDGLTVRTADLSRAEPPRWAWLDRIVIGYLNLIVGNEGVGKGTLVAWLIGRLTNGELPGDLRGTPVGVAVIGDEDSFDGVWVPRLHAAGADLARVVQVERPDGGFIDLREDAEKLAEVVSSERLGVLFFDQLLDNLGVGVDDWRSKQVRDALQPLRAVARRLEVAALGSMHPNKRGEGFRELMSGAVAFNALSRSSLLLAQHPDDEARRVLVRGKGNLSTPPLAVEFQIAEHRFAANGHDFRVPVAQGFATGPLTVDDLVGTAGATAEHSKIADAAEIIGALLPRVGWHPAKPIYEACAAENLDERTVKRAKARLGVEHRRADTFPASTLWRWPTQDTHGTSAESVPSVPSVLSVGRDSEDRQDSEDTENARPECVPTELAHRIRAISAMPSEEQEAAWTALEAEQRRNGAAA